MGRYSEMQRSWELFFTVMILYKIWRKYPYLRLSQLLYFEEDTFYTEDNELIKKLKKKMERFK